MSDELSKFEAESGSHTAEKGAVCICHGEERPHAPHQPCDSGCQPDWHKDGCAIYLPLPPEKPVMVSARVLAHTYDPWSGKCACGEGPLSVAEHREHVLRPGQPTVGDQS